MPNNIPVIMRSIQPSFVLSVLPLVAACYQPPPTQITDPADPTTIVRPSNLKAGDYNGTLAFEGVDRTYTLHVPPQHNGRALLPLVVMLHGGFGSAENAARDYGWPATADANGFYVVFPDGTGTIQTWNAMHCCGYALRNNVNDVAFVRTLVQALRGVLPIDAKRVYATGMSNGAMLCHRLAAEANDVLAAVGPVAGSIGGQVDQNSPVVMPPVPKGAVSVIIFHGTADQSVLFGGGPSQSPVAGGRIDLSVNEAVSFWAQSNRTESTPLVETIAGGGVTKSFFARRGTSAEVVLYAVSGQGHAWPGGLKPFPGADEPSSDISATETIWEFFAAHPKP